MWQQREKKKWDKKEEKDWGFSGVPIRHIGKMTKKVSPYEPSKKLISSALIVRKISVKYVPDQVNPTSFTSEIEQAAPPKWLSMSSFKPFKGDSDPERHLKHFKSAMILYKAEDALMCKVFAMPCEE
ncbi:hypothetical protein L3X38_000063 [Prunus dulcis]|uniref:Uncharacterized protein n=1 Tax=Prunus dulcis TaxID=3755 RepID=A0AAD4UT42_PRUDU|nr:hypothetical protein L3X38_000063 [Prunus dulcis]